MHWKSGAEVPETGHWLPQTLRYLSWANLAVMAVLLGLALGGVLYWGPVLGGAVALLSGWLGLQGLALVLDCSIYAARTVRALEDQVGRVQRDQGTAEQELVRVVKRLDGIRTLILSQEAGED